MTLNLIFLLSYESFPLIFRWWVFSEVHQTQPNHHNPHYLCLNFQSTPSVFIELQICLGCLILLIIQMFCDAFCFVWILLGILLKLTEDFINLSFILLFLFFVFYFFVSSQGILYLNYLGYFCLHLAFFLCFCLHQLTLWKN